MIIPDEAKAVFFKKMKINIYTNRLFIRQLQEEDFQDSIEHRIDPEVCKYISKPMTIKEVFQFVIKQSKAWSGKLNEHLALAVVLKSESKLIGELKVKYANLTEKIIEIGFRFNKKYHKKGYAIEATEALINHLFSEFKLNRIIAICIDQNTDSYRLMQKLGMQRSTKKLPTVQIGGVEMVQIEYFITKNMWNDRFQKTKKIFNNNTQ